MIYRIISNLLTSDACQAAADVVTAVGLLATVGTIVGTLF